MKEYTMSESSDFLTYFGYPFVFILFGGTTLIVTWLFFFTESTVPVGVFICLILILLGVLGVVVIGILDINNGRVTITNDSIHIISTLKNRTLKFEEIDGYKISDADKAYGGGVYMQICFIPYDKNKKEITIPYSAFEYGEEIRAWAQRTFVDLDQVEREQEELKMRKNKNFGKNIQGRLQRLKQAKKVALITNWTGVGIAVCTLFFPHLYSILLCVTFLLSTLIIAIFFRGLIKIGDTTDSNTIYPTVIYGIIGIFLAFMIRIKAIIDLIS